MCILYEEFASLLAVAACESLHCQLIPSRRKNHAKQFMNIRAVKSPERIENKVLTLMLVLHQ